MEKIIKYPISKISKKTGQIEKWDSICVHKNGKFHKYSSFDHKIIGYCKKITSKFIFIAVKEGGELDA